MTYSKYRRNIRVITSEGVKEARIEYSVMDGPSMPRVITLSSVLYGYDGGITYTPIRTVDAMYGHGEEGPI